jgi:hypothetical protein
LAIRAASFYAHVYIDKDYHVEGSRLERFAWFRRKRQLHFAHHLHANSMAPAGAIDGDHEHWTLGGQ